MTKLLIQHGPAKGQKIDKAFNKNNVDGTIFSPRDELIQNINIYCNESNFLNRNNTFIDAQFYYSTFSSDLLKLLGEQFEYPKDVIRKDWRKKTERIINYFNQYSSEVKKISNNIITPGFCIETIDWKFDYSIDIYEYFKNNYDFDEYYMTLMFSSEIFHSKNDIDDILEELKENIEDSQTSDGVYLIIKYPSSQVKNYESIDPETLSNILYFINMLRSYGYKVIIGYCFLNSVLFSALGCEYIATGWFNNLRKFEDTKFENTDSFGIRKKRYLSTPTLTYMPLELINECKAIDISKLYSGTEWDEQAIDDQDNVSFVDLEQEYWEALHGMITEINKMQTVKEKLEFLKSVINNSRAVCEEILKSTEGRVEVQNRIKLQFKHIDDWSFAIELFEKKVALI